MRVVSLFSGAGGLDLGFIQAGHEIIWANDNFKDATITYSSNLGDHICSDSILEVKSNKIPDCDVIIGGFPCQGFSVANMKRHVGDSRNRLYVEMIRLIRDKKPRYFLAENVKGLVSMDNGSVLNLVLHDFRESGYRVKYKVLNTADFGVPQQRHRVIIIGTRLDVEQEIDFPMPTHSTPDIAQKLSKLPWVSVGEALQNIPEPEDAPELPNHVCSQYKLRFNGYIGHRAIDPDKPAPTVTGRGDDRGGVVVLHHPRNHRRMSARELATVQSFPQDYVFSGCLSSVYRQIANAVPPKFAHAVATMFPQH